MNKVFAEIGVALLRPKSGTHYTIHRWLLRDANTKWQKISSRTSNEERIKAGLNPEKLDGSHNRDDRKSSFIMYQKVCSFITSEVCVACAGTSHLVHFHVRLGIYCFEFSTNGYGENVYTSNGKTLRNKMWSIFNICIVLLFLRSSMKLGCRISWGILLIKHTFSGRGRQRQQKRYLPYIKTFIYTNYFYKKDLV